MEQRVVITGIGAITPVGNHIEDTWKNLVEGVCGIDFIKGLDEYNLPVKVAGQVKNFDQSEYELNAGLLVVVISSVCMLWLPLQML
jgi:3-oxoacyl-[acyl-carrier-protein] synthase II